MPMEVPENDTFYAQFNVTRLGIKRTHICKNCGNGPVYQMNQATSYADLSQVYAHNSQTLKALRRYKSGLMLTQDLGGDEYIADSLLPYADKCSIPEKNAFCSRAGDIRANQQPGILSMQTLWVREHNRLASRLACINPHWDDEQVFQVVR
ncbi:hypothetical protein HPB50_024665 [Hyalomma asiaticum]|uniref:Uncharacterized protein n=1 Tax=Hyalomma asiaticum TaxID=266040 RepID=A0ACB7RNE1_HYAAI|nr:hypothetical protein HPB50_024665 [Hyalomma asiaticum]